jgi:hypothetical protein
MNSELQEKLRKKYSFLKDIYFECEDGWYNIIDKLCDDIKKVISSPKDIYVSQVKQKWGSLRFYCSVMKEEEKVWDLISAAEEESSKTCEICGGKGESRELAGVWILCDKDYEAKKKEGF